MAVPQEPLNETEHSEGSRDIPVRGVDGPCYAAGNSNAPISDSMRSTPFPEQ